MMVKGFAGNVYTCPACGVRCTLFNQNKLLCSWDVPKYMQMTDAQQKAIDTICKDLHIIYGGITKQQATAFIHDNIEKWEQVSFIKDSSEDLWAYHEYGSWYDLL